MRSSCEVVIEINMVKAIHGEHKIPFYISENKVILAEGLSDGSLPLDYFRSVFNFKTKEILHEAPIKYLCVYDFECTCDDTPKDQPPKIQSQEIIEFPIVIVDVETM